MREMHTYIYANRVVRPGSGLEPTPEEARVFSVHYDYLKGKLEDGELILAGPCLDEAYGIVIFRAESDEAAKRFMDEDPAIRNGLMTAEVHRFRISLHNRGPEQ